MYTIHVFKSICSKHLILNELFCRKQWLTAVDGLGAIIKDRNSFHTCARACFYSRYPKTEETKTMPKPNHKKEKLKHIKVREKGFNVNYPSQIDIHVVGSGGRGCPRSVMLSTTYSRYLFNCGEGTQRIATEFKMKLAKLENIFITHKHWSNIGGLMGMCLTLEEAAVPKIVIHGPPHVEKITSMIKGFAETPEFTLIKRELDEQYFDDGTFRIDYVPFYSDKSVRFVNVGALATSTDGDKTDDTEPDNKRLKIEDNNVSVAYICTARPPRPSLLLDKCVALGVKPGPLFSQLQNGQSITLDNGKVVDPVDVLKPLVIQKPIIVVDCVSSDFLPSLLSNSQFKRFTENPENKTENIVDILIHMTPVEVMELQQYQDWMKNFGPETKHLVINESAKDICHTGLYRLQTMLNLVHPRIFPLLPHLTKPRQTEDTSHNNIHIAHTNLIYQYRPAKGFIRDQGPDINIDEFKKEATTKETVRLLEKLKENLSNKESDVTDKEFPEVVFLGTGGSVPTKDRNVTCILVRINEETNLLLDCGEGSSAQIYRHYGPQTDEILRNIKGVFISHMHVDHHLGFFNVLLKRNESYGKINKVSPPLLVIGPGMMEKWMRFFDANIKPILQHVKFIPMYRLLPHEVDISDECLKLVLEHLQLQDFLPVEVEHCRKAYGVRLESNGIKLVYSGDTMPCSRLIKAGENCDLLIHEATMEDALLEDAKFKTHSTTRQAINVGKEMKAKFTILNHFSQRYSKTPIFTKYFTDKVGISFDNMRVRLSDLPLLPEFLPVFKAMFADQYADLELKTQKRTNRRQLIDSLKSQHKSDTKKKVTVNL